MHEHLLQFIQRIYDREKAVCMILIILFAYFAYYFNLIIGDHFLFPYLFECSINLLNLHLFYLLVYI